MNLKVLLCLLFLGVCHGQLFVQKAKDGWNLIESPGYGADRLPWSSYSVWYMKPKTPGRLLYLDFLEFNMEGEEPCERNFMEIHDSGTVRGRFCTKTSFSMLSFGPWVELRLQWDMHVRGSGFRLRYKQVLPEHPRGSLGCDVVLNIKGEHSPEMVFSPNYPNSMPRGTNCSWEINAPPEFRIKISGKYVVLSDCEAYLAVFEGSVEAVRFCGGDSEVFVTNGNHAVLWTRSGHVNATFWIQAEATRDPPSIYGSCPAKEKMTKDSGQVATKEVLTIALLNYDISNYVSNMDCYWVIRAEDPGHTVQVSMVHSSIETSHDCSKDYLAGYDGPATSGPLLFKWCGDQDANGTSLSDSITLVFHSDSSVQDKGFLLQYTMGPARLNARNNTLIIILTALLSSIAALTLLFGLLMWCMRRRRAEPANAVELELLRVRSLAKDPETSGSTPCPSDSTLVKELFDSSSKGGGVQNEQDFIASRESLAPPMQDGNGACATRLPGSKSEEEAGDPEVTIVGIRETSI